MDRITLEQRTDHVLIMLEGRYFFLVPGEDPDNPADGAEIASMAKVPDMATAALILAGDPIWPHLERMPDKASPTNRVIVEQKSDGVKMVAEGDFFFTVPGPNPDDPDAGADAVREVKVHDLDSVGAIFAAHDVWPRLELAEGAGEDFFGE